MLEDPADRTGGNVRTIRGSELDAWERLTLKLGVHDVWYLHSVCSIPGSLCFSRSNRRRSNAEASSEDDDSQINAVNGRGEINESRIGRFYVS